MSWIKENKVAASIIGATVVLSGAFAYLGKSANADAEVARKKENAAVSKIDSLQAAQPYPNKENKEMLAENLASFAADTKAFQESILTYRPEDLPKLTPNEFSAEVSKYINKLNRYYQAKKIENKGGGDTAYGMELYRGQMAEEKSTRYLDFNRQALEWLFMSLADSGIESLNNVYRAPVAEKMGDPPVTQAKPKPKPGARGRGIAAKKAPEALTSVYEGLPIQITFTGTEANLQEFVTKITTGDQYFFIINFLKIINHEQDPVTISKAVFPPSAVAPAADPIEPGADGTTPPDAAPTPSDGSVFDFGEAFGPEFGTGASQNKEIVKQVIGDEKITVFMHLELVLFKEASKVTIPGLKPEETDKESVKKGTPK